MRHWAIVGDPQADGGPNPELVEAYGPIRVTPLRNLSQHQMRTVWAAVPHYADGTDDDDVSEGAEEGDDDDDENPVPPPAPAAYDNDSVPPSLPPPDFHTDQDSYLQPNTVTASEAPPVKSQPPTVNGPPSTSPPGATPAPRWHDGDDLIPPPFQPPSIHTDDDSYLQPTATAGQPSVVSGPVSQPPAAAPPTSTASPAPGSDASNEMGSSLDPTAAPEETAQDRYQRHVAGYSPQAMATDALAQGMSPAEVAQKVRGQIRDDARAWGAANIPNAEQYFARNRQLDADIGKTLRGLQQQEVSAWATRHFADADSFAQFRDSYLSNPAAAAALNPDAKSELDGILQSPAYQSLRSSNQSVPILASSGDELGVYQVQPRNDGGSDVLVNVHPPQGKMTSGVLHIPAVTDADVNAARQQAQQQLASAQQAGEQAQATVRLQQLSGPNAKLILQQEAITNAFKNSTLAAQAGQRDLGEDFQRGIANLALSLQYAAAEPFRGTQMGDQVLSGLEQKMRSLQQVLPGTTRPTTSDQFWRGVSENAGPGVVYALPGGVGQTALAASTFGSGVAQAHMAADENDRLADQVATQNPELATRLRAVSQQMRDDARLYGGLSAATVVAAGKVIPGARSMLGQTARGAAEMGLIATTQGQVLSPLYLHQRQDPMEIPKAMLLGAGMGFAGGLYGKARSAPPSHGSSNPDIPFSGPPQSYIVGDGELRAENFLHDAPGNPSAPQAGAPARTPDYPRSFGQSTTSDTVPIAPGYSNGHASADVYARPIEVSGSPPKSISDAYQPETQSENESEYAGVTGRSDSQVSAAANESPSGGGPTKAHDQFKNSAASSNSGASGGSGSSGNQLPPSEGQPYVSNEDTASETVPPAPPPASLKQTGGAAGHPIAQTGEGTPTSSAAEAEPLPLTPYNKGGGHHPLIGSAFEGDDLYDYKSELAIANDTMENAGIKHPVVTGAQKRLYRTHAKTGKPLTWDTMQSIETQALMDGGCKSQEVAAATIKKAIDILKARGVKPRRVPWGDN